ncbi:MAG TPA: glycoside hydrolase family 16 protein [Polyangia bacterium]|nr:glycoside hydrolase family 16 protein [Polyangia bacterium]
MKFRASLSTLGLAIAVAAGCSNPPSQPGSTGGTTGSTGGTTGSTGGTSGSTGGTSGSTGGTTGSTGGSGGDTTPTGGTGGTTPTGGSGGTTTPTGGTGGTAAGGTGGTAAGGTTGGGAETEVACPSGVVGHCSSGVTYDTHAGFTLAMVEDFPGNLDLDTDPIWTWSDGGPHPDGQTRFDKGSITFANGRMIITATSPAGGVAAGTSYAESDKCKTTTSLGKLPVLSGEFRTKYNNYRYGRYEAKLKAPVENTGKNADGNFLATLFAFRTPKWNYWNEIDIELEANIKGSVAYNTVNPANTGNTAYPNSGHAAGSVPMGNGFNIQTDHVYAFEWTNNNIVWYVDGKMIKDCAGGTCKGDGNASIPNKSAKIMLNLWVFNSAAAFGNPANNTYPFHSEYDYFHFYKWDNETTYPYSDVSKIPQDDLAFSQNNPSETTYPQKTFTTTCPQ